MIRFRKWMSRISISAQWSMHGFPAGYQFQELPSMVGSKTRGLSMQDLFGSAQRDDLSGPQSSKAVSQVGVGRRPFPPSYGYKGSQWYLGVEGSQFLWPRKAKPSRALMWIFLNKKHLLSHTCCQGSSSSIVGWFCFMVLMKEMDFNFGPENSHLSVLCFSLFKPSVQAVSPGWSFDEECYRIWHIFLSPHVSSAQLFASTPRTLSLDQGLANYWLAGQSPAFLWSSNAECFFILKELFGASLVVLVVKNSPANAGDVGSIPSPGRFHMLWAS